MRIMLDTNVLISILVFDSKSLKEMLLKIVDNNTLVLSTYVIEELKEVIKRKFPTKTEDLDKFLYSLTFEIYFTPKSIMNNNFIDIKDKKDAPVLYSSIMCQI